MGSGDFPPFPLYLDALRSPQESEGEFLSPWSLCFWRSQNDATQPSWPEILSAGLEHSTKRSPMCPHPQERRSQIRGTRLLDRSTDKWMSPHLSSCNRFPIYRTLSHQRLVRRPAASLLYERNNSSPPTSLLDVRPSCPVQRSSLKAQLRLDIS